MTNTLLLGTAASTAPDVDEDAVRGLADELLAGHADAGVSVATLVEADAVTWETVRPWVAGLVAEGAHTVGQLAGLAESRIPDGSPLAATDAVPPVVWARQVGIMHRQLGQAVRGLGDGSTPDQQAAVLRAALGRVRTVAAALHAAALRV